MTGMPPSFQALVSEAVDRLEAAAAARKEKFSVRALEKEHGISNGTISPIIKGKRRSVDHGTLPKLAKALALDVQVVQQAMTGPVEDPSEEHTPHTPPAQSTTRATRTFVDRIPEYVRDWVSDVLQSLGSKRYTGDQVRAAEAYIAGFAFKREQNTVPRRLVLGALEAARAVEVPGEPIDVAAMGAYLAERNAPESGPQVEPVETRPMAPGLRALVNRRKREREDQ